MIDRFKGKYRYLSNFWLDPVTMGGKVYPSVENAYQAAKIEKKAGRDFFLTCSPAEAKKKGQEIEATEGFNKVRWDLMKLNTMKGLLWKKFTEGSFLAEKLIATGFEDLVEGNNWGDVFWGVCGGVGENHLGNLLKVTRKTLQENLDEGDLWYREKKVA